MRLTDRRTIFGLRWTDDMEEFCMNRWENAGHAWEARRDGCACAIGGINQYTPGCAVLWFIATDSWRGIMIEVTRFLRKVLLYRLLSEDYRVECMVLACDSRAMEYARRLGFKDEGISRQLGRYKEDYHRMAMFNES